MNIMYDGATTIRNKRHMIGVEKYRVRWERMGYRCTSLGFSIWKENSGSVWCFFYNRTTKSHAHMYTQANDLVTNAHISTIFPPIHLLLSLSSSLLSSGAKFAFCPIPCQFIIHVHVQVHNGMWCKTKPSIFNVITDSAYNKKKHTTSEWRCELKPKYMLPK